MPVLFLSFLFKYLIHPEFLLLQRNCANREDVTAVRIISEEFVSAEDCPLLVCGCKGRNILRTIVHEKSDENIHFGNKVAKIVSFFVTLQAWISKNAN